MAKTIPSICSLFRLTLSTLCGMSLWSPTKLPLDRKGFPVEFKLFGELPNVYRSEDYRRAWRIFGSRNSNGDRYYVTLSRCVKSDSAIGWSLDHKRVRVPA